MITALSKRDCIIETIYDIIIVIVVDYYTMIGGKKRNDHQ